MNHTKQAFSETDGRRLAVKMLEELADVGADRACIDASTRLQAGFKGPQANVVGRYLALLRERGSVELEAGFGAILSDFIASNLDGGADAELEFYEARIEAKVAPLRREHV
jgi:hypothetical protein